MAAFSYVNGSYVSVADAAIGVEDRGFQFGDSIYEVIAVLNGALLDEAKHLWRLRRGLAALFIEGLPSDKALQIIIGQLLSKARLRDGLLYIQVSRGEAPRNHPFPTRKGVRPTLVMTVRGFNFQQRLDQLKTGVVAITRDDIRWQRSDLKTVMLLPAVLAKEEARRAGVFEVMFVKDGVVTEGASTNMWMVNDKGTILTHPHSTAILPGIARDTLLELVRGQGIQVEERPFTVEEAKQASELFLTSTSAPILPIVTLDGQPVGKGKPGPVVQGCAHLVWQEIKRQTGWSGYSKRILGRFAI